MFVETGLHIVQVSPELPISISDTGTGESLSSLDSEVFGLQVCTGRPEFV